MMCQAYEGEARFVMRTELMYGTLKAARHGYDPLPDYCYTHGNYWCGCKPEQSDPLVKAQRRIRQLEAQVGEDR